MHAVCSLALAEISKVESFFLWSSLWQICPSDGQHPRVGARCKADSDTRWRHHQKLVSDVDNWLFALVWTSKRILDKYKLLTCTTNWVSHECYSSLSCVTPVTIMVGDTISSVKLWILLKLLLSSGSTTTKIDTKAYLNIVTWVWQWITIAQSTSPGI